MKLHEQIAEKISERLASSSEAYLPSLTRLSRSYRVSPQTMSAALSLLREKGLLDYSRGRRIRITAATHPGGTSLESFADGIRQRIAEGIYRVGQPLPKAGCFVITGHLSKSTVCDALKQLAEEGLIHKKGKAWVAGPAPGRVTAAGSAHPSAPVVLV
ncbi:MAG: GntR family transcriptional regulator, partial [Chitinivibrionales bacterium]|nr:GntR family transcriptional regulator [Chitinivibrionales bacterium]MBD3394759.1 GntR family transcriptional regulator [Chitinivibrionales bacterium]